MMRIVFRGAALVAAAMMLASAPAAAQVRTVDPNSAIDADLAPQQAPPPATAPDTFETVDPGVQTGPGTTIEPATPAANAAQAARTTDAAGTYQREDLLAAAEGVFGKGAQGLAGMVERLLKEQGQPNAYIAGREASGAFVVGLRYGSGLMTHKVEGQRPVYWTGPSVGFDVGGDATKVFALVYNLFDTQDIYKRFPAAEGRLYFVGGFSATYLRRGNIVLIPIRLGVGWRAGANIGYMKLSEKAKWLPF
jgi:hypothetical protein